MANITNITDLCLLSSKISNSFYFCILMILQIVLGLLAFFSNFIFLSVLRKSEIFHINLRLLMGHLSVNLLLIAFISIIKALYYSMTIVIWSSCGLVISSYNCGTQESPYVILSVNVVYMVPAILLERLYSTIRHKTYDQSKPWISALLFVATWIITVTLTLPGFIAQQQDVSSHSRYLPICESLMNVPAPTAAAITIMESSMEASSLAISIGVYYYNRYKLQHVGMNRAKQTLASRFQICQNVAINQIMMPTILLHSLCYFLNYMVLTIVFLKGDTPAHYTAWFLHSSYTWRLVYALAFPILAIKGSPVMQKRLGHMRFIGKLWNRIQRKNVQIACVDRNNADMGNLHFQMLAEVWNK